MNLKKHRKKMQSRNALTTKKNIKKTIFLYLIFFILQQNLFAGWGYSWRGGLDRLSKNVAQMYAVVIGYFYSVGKPIALTVPSDMKVILPNDTQQKYWANFWQTGINSGDLLVLFVSSDQKEYYIPLSLLDQALEKGSFIIHNRSAQTFHLTQDYGVYEQVAKVILSRQNDFFVGNLSQKEIDLALKANNLQNISQEMRGQPHYKLSSSYALDLLKRFSVQPLALILIGNNLFLPNAAERARAAKLLRNNNQPESGEPFLSVRGPKNKEYRLPLSTLIIACITKKNINIFDPEERYGLVQLLPDEKCEKQLLAFWQKWIAPTHQAEKTFTKYEWLHPQLVLGFGKEIPTNTVDVSHLSDAEIESLIEKSIIRKRLVEIKGVDTPYYELNRNQYDLSDLIEELKKKQL